MQRTGIWIDGEDSLSPELQAEAKESWKKGSEDGKALEEAG